MNRHNNTRVPNNWKKLFASEVCLIKGGCDKYNTKHDISISFNDDEKPYIAPNEGIIYRYIYKKNKLLYRHYAGCYRIDLLDDENIKRPYYIFFDTFPGTTVTKTNSIKDYLNEIHENNCKFINIGSGLQTDSKSCMVFALKGIEILAKDNSKVAKKITEFLIKNNFFEEKNDISFDIVKGNEKLRADYNLKVLPYAGDFIKLAQSGKVQKENGGLVCHEDVVELSKQQNNKFLLTKKRERTTVEKYFNDHCEYDEVTKKQRSNKINNLYQKMMVLPKNKKGLKK